MHSRLHILQCDAGVEKGRTREAQEIEAVNKGPSDKGSPDSYESRAE